jgi:hypothetical protein
MNTITIGGVQHPLIFNMNSLRNVMAHIGMESFEDLQKHLNIAKSLDLSVTCAFYGMYEGYESKGETMTFKDEIEIARKITKYTELMPALNGFTKSITDFFETEESGEKK